MNRTEQIWREYHAHLHRFIQRRVHDRSIAEDILQDVFVKIQSRIITLKEEKKIQSWIFQITRNAIIDHFRVIKKTSELPETLASPEKDLSDKARQELVHCLLPMIQSLPELYRKTLLLSEIESVSQKEVAQKLSLSLSAVKSRIQRGRERLKKLLLECCRLEFDHQGTVTDFESKEKVKGNGPLGC